MSLTSALNIFLSSTCHDLVDLRPELSRLLVQNGFNVKMSEDPNSAFYVDPDDDSIQSCINNVEASDAVVAVIDRRYGGLLKTGPLKGLSATHAEINHARAIAKPTFFFIRQAAFQEYDHMRRNGWQFKTSWVEPDSGTSNPRRENWFKFVEEIASYPKHQQWSNWCDQFTSSVDLGTLVVKRLFDHFPKQVSVLALRPERLVRLTFTHLSNHQNGTVRGYFQNVGTGPAIDLVHGVRNGDSFTEEHNHGGLMVGMKLCPTDQGLMYQTNVNNSNPLRCVYCKYRNVHGDWFRVEKPVTWSGTLPVADGPERFFVGNNGIPELAWVQVS